MYMQTQVHVKYQVQSSLHNCRIFHTATQQKHIHVPPVAIYLHEGTLYVHV